MTTATTNTETRNRVQQTAAFSTGRLMDSFEAFSAMQGWNDVDDQSYKEVMSENSNQVVDVLVTETERIPKKSCS